MDFSTETFLYRTVRGLALLLALVIAQGCATGRLLEAGRRTEAVRHYESAYTDGRYLWLVYSTEVVDRGDRGLSLRRRSAAIELAALDPAAGYPLDAFPLEHVAASDVPRDAAQPVALRVEGEGSARSSAAIPSLLVETRGERHTGFTLEHFAGVSSDARFYSGALVEHRPAAWVYPVLPFALAWDAVWTPFLASLATPFLLIRE
jgi:hypothetical protein